MKDQPAGAHVCIEVKWAVFISFVDVDFTPGGPYLSSIRLEQGAKVSVTPCPVECRTFRCYQCLQSSDRLATKFGEYIENLFEPSIGHLEG
jgi:hypothetical protein